MAKRSKLHIHRSGTGPRCLCGLHAGYTVRVVPVEEFSTSIPEKKWCRGCYTKLTTLEMLSGLEL